MSINNKNVCLALNSKLFYVCFFFWVRVPHGPWRRKSEFSRFLPCSCLNFRKELQKIQKEKGGGFPGSYKWTTEAGGMAASVLKMHVVSAAHCALFFWWHQFNAMNWYYFTHFFSLGFHPGRFAETCIQAYSWKCGASIESYSQSPEGCTATFWETLRKNWDPECYSGLSPSPGQGFVWHLVLINW